MSNAFRGTMLLAALTLAACSGGGGGSGTPAGDPGVTTGTSREDYAARLAEWLCDDLAACCAGTGQPIDRDACIATRRTAELRRVEREEEHSGRAFDEHMAATCVAELAETPASCGSERRVRACFRTYDGSREPGEECASKFECRGSLRGDVGCVRGRCTDRLPAGEACPAMADDQPGRCDVCRPEARCRETVDGRHLCFAYASKRGVAGDPCVRPFALPDDPTTVSVVADCPFEDGLACGADGTCQPFPPAGASCRFDSDCGPSARCAGGICRDGRGNGEECTSRFHQCGEGLYCRFSGFVCIDPPGGSAPECSEPEYTGGRCEAPRAEGAACGWFARCATGLACVGARTPYQDDGVCTAANVAACQSGTARLERQAARQASR